MSTGDLKNNFRKLQLELRHIQYPDELDLDNLTKGATAAYLPIYHHVMVSYSHPLAEQISNMGIELAGKTDLRFIEGMYKVLRELFAYKPPLTINQFFSSGFAERKVIMCTEIIGLVHKRHLLLGPKARVKGVPRHLGSSGAAGLSMVPKALSASQPSMSFSGASPSDDARHSVYKQPKAKSFKSGKLNRSTAMASTTSKPALSSHSSIQSRVVNELRNRSPKPVVTNSRRTARSPNTEASISKNERSPPIVVKCNEYDILSPKCGSAEVGDMVEINSSTPTRFEDRQRLDAHEAKLDVLVARLNAQEVKLDALQTSEITKRLCCIEEKMAENISEMTPQLEKCTHRIGESSTCSQSGNHAMSSGTVSNVLARLTLLENKLDMINMQNKSGHSQRSGQCNRSECWSPSRDPDPVDDKPGDSVVPDQMEVNCENQSLSTEGEMDDSDGHVDSLEEMENNMSPIENKINMDSPIVGGSNMDSPALGEIQKSEAWGNACSSTPIDDGATEDDKLLGTSGIGEYLQPETQEQANKILVQLKETQNLLQSQILDAGASVL